MKVIYDERDWKIRPTLDRKQCPYLSFPANIYQCDHPSFGIHNPECNMDICPIRVIENANDQCSPTAK